MNKVGPQIRLLLLRLRLNSSGEPGPLASEANQQFAAYRDRLKKAEKEADASPEARRETKLALQDIEQKLRRFEMLSEERAEENGNIETLISRCRQKIGFHAESALEAIRHFNQYMLAWNTKDEDESIVILSNQHLRKVESNFEQAIDHSENSEPKKGPIDQNTDNLDALAQDERKDCKIEPLVSMRIS